MADVTFEDLTEQAADAAGEAADEASGSTGEWVQETVELLDKRGLLEPILFGPENAEVPSQQVAEEAAAEGEDGDDGGGPDLDAASIANAGEAIMDELGEDVTVAELVNICEANPALVNSKIEEHL